MGGLGSGRHRRLGAKEVTDSYRSIDIRRWLKEGHLEPDNSFRWVWSLDGEISMVLNVWVEATHLTLSHLRPSGSKWAQERYTVDVNWTPCHFGGRRPWFICPAAGCYRRAAILYLEGIFACRHCHQIAYQCQRESRGDRAYRRANRIREKLGWDPGIFGMYGKPKGMRWSTFERLTDEHDRLKVMSDALFDQRLGIGGEGYQLGFGELLKATEKRR